MFRGRHSSMPVNDTREASHGFTSPALAKRSGWAESAAGEEWVGESHFGRAPTAGETAKVTVLAASTPHALSLLSISSACAAGYEDNRSGSYESGCTLPSSPNNVQG